MGLVLMTFKKTENSIFKNLNQSSCEKNVRRPILELTSCKLMAFEETVSGI